MEIVAKVWKNNSNGQKMITIPKDNPIQAGDYVLIRPMNEK